MKTVTLPDNELCIVLRFLTETLANMKTPDNERDLWEKKKLEAAVDKFEKEYHRKTPDEFKPFVKEYSGFERAIDIEEEITWWLQNDAALCPEYNGTLRITIYYFED